MKEIGEALKEQREAIGISLEEAANDLKLKVEQIEAIEAGDKNAFKEISSLKYFVRDYSKYLGLNYEDMIDDFNEFLFDYTSKISMDEIKKAKKEVEVAKSKEEQRIASPYTINHKKKHKLPLLVAIILIILVTVVTVTYCVSKINDKKDNVIADNIIK